MSVYNMSMLYNIARNKWIDENYMYDIYQTLDIDE